jgi:uncharacterized protein
LEDTLYSLIELQEIDMKLDKVREERGDLPERVESLTNVISEKDNLIEVQKQEVKSLTVENKKAELELNSSKEKLKKYQDQLYQVKTNKEYDAISQETENVQKTIDELETNILSVDERIENLTTSNENMEKELIELRNDFQDSNSELQAKINASSEEENILRQERDIVQNKLTRQQLSAYDRIREAKKGMAVASCNGGICSGCYSFVPPQKVVEIRNMKRLYYCESCGRILVFDKNVE